MQTGIDYQATGSKGQRLQIAQPADRESLVNTEFIGQLLGDPAADRTAEEQQEPAS